MPRSWAGRGSSVDEDKEGSRDVCVDGDDCEGIGSISRSSESDSSSSPMANAPLSSGTLLKVGIRALCGLRMLSTELARDVRVGLEGESGLSSAACLRRFMRSISAWPLSKVNDRKASKRFRDLKIALTKTLLPKIMSLRGLLGDAYQYLLLY